jgi:hypothetical protein
MLAQTRLLVPKTLPISLSGGEFCRENGHA